MMAAGLKKGDEWGGSIDLAHYPLSYRVLMENSMAVESRQQGIKPNIGLVETSPSWQGAKLDK